MAFMSQERKAKIAPKVKEILNKYDLNGSLSVQDHSTLVLKIKSGSIDFIQNYRETVAASQHRPLEAWQLTDYIKPNRYHLSSEFTGVALSAMQELVEAMMDGNHDNSDPYTDYFDVGWYISVNIGTYSKAYELEMISSPA
jgi:hypothetical protein